MIEFLQIAAVLTIVLATTPAVAHALELPGKMRLTREDYRVVQRIYYPGFTFAGAAEPLGILLTIALLLLLPYGSRAFLLTLVSLLGLVGMQIVYWLVTHPVNKFWLEGQPLSRLGSGFFSFTAPGRGRMSRGTAAPEWTELRDRWEHSHVVRAALAATSLVTLVLAIS